MIGEFEPWFRGELYALSREVEDFFSLSQAEIETQAVVILFNSSDQVTLAMNYINITELHTSHKMYTTLA